MMDALEKVGGKEKLKLLEEKEDPALLPILLSWPSRFDNTQAIGLGFTRDESFEQAVRDYKDSIQLETRGTGTMEQQESTSYGVQSSVPVQV